MIPAGRLLSDDSLVDAGRVDCDRENERPETSVIGHLANALPPGNPGRVLAPIPVDQQNDGACFGAVQVDIDRNTRTLWRFRSIDHGKAGAAGDVLIEISPIVLKQRQRDVFAGIGFRMPRDVDRQEWSRQGFGLEIAHVTPAVGSDPFLKRMRSH